MNTILLVEDDASFAEVVRKALVSFGYEAIHAQNGRDALRLFDPKAMLVVLTDLLMPDMDGLQLIVKLQELDPAVRIIAMTGGGRCAPDAYLPMAQRLGAVKTLAKPFPLEELRSAVRECLDQS